MTTKTTKTTTKATEKRKYVRLKDAGDVCQKIGTSSIWLSNGKYDTPSFTINMDDKEALSDWAHMIELRDVYIQVVENKNGFKTLCITGTDDLPF